MSCIQITLSDGSFYDFEIKQMTPETVFELVKQRKIDFAQFDEWRNGIFMDGYQEALNLNWDRGEDD
jgi:hypothetical protein